MTAQDIEDLLSRQADKLSAPIRDFVAALKLEREAEEWTPLWSPDTFRELIAYRQGCYLKSLIVFNGGVGTNFLQVHNAINTPPEGFRTVLPPMAVPPQATQAFDFGEKGVYFSTGLYFCGSSTAVLKTLIATNDFFIYALMRPA